MILHYSLCRELIYPCVNWSSDYILSTFWGHFLTSVCMVWCRNPLKKFKDCNNCWLTVITCYLRWLNIASWINSKWCPCMFYLWYMFNAQCERKPKSKRMTWSITIEHLQSNQSTHLIEMETHLIAISIRSRFNQLFKIIWKPRS